MSPGAPGLAAPEELEAGFVPLVEGEVVSSALSLEQPVIPVLNIIIKAANAAKRNIEFIVYERSTSGTHIVEQPGAPK